MRIRKNKKGMELSLNIVVIAIIALIVLIVMIMIFTGQFGKFIRSTNQTSSQYAADKCKVPGTGRGCSSQESCENAGGYVYPKPENGWSDCLWGQECCSAGV